MCRTGCGNIACNWFECILQLLCTRKFRGAHGGVNWHWSPKPSLYLWPTVLRTKKWGAWWQISWGLDSRKSVDCWEYSRVTRSTIAGRDRRRMAYFKTSWEGGPREYCQNVLMLENKPFLFAKNIFLSKENSWYMPTRSPMVLRRERAQKEVSARQCFSWWNTETLAEKRRCCGPLTNCSPSAPSDMSFHIVPAVLTRFFKVSLPRHVSVPTCCYWGFPWGSIVRSLCIWLPL